jgi:hypothetical protein
VIDTASLVLAFGAVGIAGGIAQLEPRHILLVAERERPALDIRPA